MINAAANIEALIKVANALGDLNERVIFVGGAVVGLYANDPSAEDVRPTQDVDITVAIASYLELEQLREELNHKGFRQTAEDNIACRFRVEEEKVDVMATKAVGWAPTNNWFGPGFQRAISIQVEQIKIKILPTEYFLASKLDAFLDRGKSDPFGSHDFEDIVYVLDNRLDLVDVVLAAPVDVAEFLKANFSRMLTEGKMQEAILGNLPYQTQQARYEKIIEKLKIICGEI